MAYSQEQIEKAFSSILLEIEKWRPVREILKDEWTPDVTTFYKWLRDDDEKAKQYARACEIRAENIFDDMLNIADDTTKDIKVDKDWVEQVNQDNIQRARLKVETRKWVLGKLNPKKFWDKLDMTSDWEKLWTYMLVTNLYDKPKGD